MARKTDAYSETNTGGVSPRKAMAMGLRPSGAADVPSYASVHGGSVPAARGDGYRRGPKA